MAPHELQYYIYNYIQYKILDVLLYKMNGKYRNQIRYGTCPYSWASMSTCMCFLVPRDVWMGAWQTRLSGKNEGVCLRIFLCFTVFCFDFLVMALTEHSLDRRIYSSEAAALEKLIAAPKLPQKEVIEVDRRKIPDNNPFKKRKANEFNSERKLSSSEQVSGVTNISELEDIACTTPDSQKSVNSKPAKNAKRIQRTWRSPNPQVRLDSRKTSSFRFFTCS